MAIIPQTTIFSWKNIESKSDLDRLSLVLATLPDESLMRKLESKRKNGRNDYPIRAVWNSLLAGIVYEHKSIESLRRELSRNGELRQLCGFNPLSGSAGVPSKDAYTHLLKNLLKESAEIEIMFGKLVGTLKELLPDFGKQLAVDSKAIDSFGNPTKKERRDGRRDTDADWGVKKYKGERKDGSLWEKLKRWFGYKLHLLVDSKYELPIAFDVKRASSSDYTNLLPLVEKTKQSHPDLIKKSEELTADRGYDSTENNQKLFDDYFIKPIIDNRLMWKKGDADKGDLKQRNLYPDRADNIVYDEKGNVSCVCPGVKDEYRQMAFCGFEKERKSLKYRCPAAAYEFECSYRSQCGNTISEYGRIVRVPLELDRRIFTPIARSSYAWDTKYKKRTSVERVNSRLDISFGFEKHTIRGMAKMKFKVGLALIVMLSMAVGHIRAGREEMMRSLVKAA